MNLTIDTAKLLARAVDANAKMCFMVAVYAHDHHDDGTGSPYVPGEAHLARIADADEGDRRAAARREAVQRLLRRKGFVVEALPVGFVTIVRAP